MMLPRYLKWPWISTRLGPTWIPGGAVVITADAGWSPWVAAVGGVTTTPIVLS